MAKITPRKDINTIVVKTMDTRQKDRPYKWWNAGSKKELAEQILSTVSFLKENQQYRYRQAALFARLYSNYPLFGWAGTNSSKISMASQLPTDRPTMNIIQSCVDTLASRITQTKPRPIFLTDAGDYKQRSLSKQLNNFLAGEFYRTSSYELGERNFKDSLILGTGCMKVLEKNNKVHLERKLLTELLIDPNDGLYGRPRQIYETQLIDRDVLAECFPNHKSDIEKAEAGYPDSSADSSRSVSDQVIIAEAWHLPSGPDAGDGRHAIVCSEGYLFDETYDKDHFPFIFDHFSERVLGFWAQGLAEQLMGTQVEINKLLMTISQSINLVGVPRVFVEDGSKVVKAHLNNQIGAIVTYRGTKPQYEVAPCIPQEVYAQLQRLVEYAYQQSGVSTLSATAQKPAGLNSGEAIRNYDDLQSDRFASISKSYDNMYIDLAYLIIDKATDIAKREGKYSTIYPGKNGTQRIDFPKLNLEDDEYVIQVFDVSSLPRDPAGRLQKIIEMIQSGMIDIREGRRLLDYPDLEQVERLANASEERILQILDDIVDSGKYVPPDNMMDIQLANKLGVQYYNLYASAKLEENKQEMLRTFITQTQALMMQAMPPPQPQGPANANPPGVPGALPVSDLMPQVPGAA